MRSSSATQGMALKHTVYSHRYTSYLMPQILPKQLYIDPYISLISPLYHYITTPYYILHAIQVRGKDFRHEKTKKKRGSYRGGSISLDSFSFKYSD